MILLRLLTISGTKTVAVMHRDFEYYVMCSSLCESAYRQHLVEIPQYPKEVSSILLPIRNQVQQTSALTSQARSI